MLEKLVGFCPMPKDSLAQMGTCFHRSTLQLPEPLLLLPPLGPRQPAHPGSPNAGRAAVRVAGHHPVHDLLDGGELRCGRAGQHPLSLDSCVTHHAGTDGEGLLNLVYLTVLFLPPHPPLWGALSGPVACNYQTVRQVRAAEMSV